MTEDVLTLMIPIIAIIMGSLIFLIPIAGFTARFALKPIVEAFGRMREIQAGPSHELGILEQRVALLEQQLSILEGTVQNAVAARHLDRRLTGSDT
jgi:hypothetical protein